MHRQHVAALVLISGVALADLGPPNVSACDAYDTASCRQCYTKPDGGELVSGCADGAVDAGFSTQACSLEKAGGTWTYYCLPGETPKRGCSSVLLGAPLALLALFGAWRTRRTR